MDTVRAIFGSLVGLAISAGGCLLIYHAMTHEHVTGEYGFGGFLIVLCGVVLAAAALGFKDLFN